MTRIATIALPLVLTLLACSSQRRAYTSEGMMGASATVLCVDNQSDGVGTIRVWVDDFRTHTVPSGSRVCRQIRNTAAGAQLYAESIGGGLRGPVRYQYDLRGAGIRCWNWILRDALASQIRLIPCKGS